MLSPEFSFELCRLWVQLWGAGLRSGRRGFVMGAGLHAGRRGFGVSPGLMLPTRDCVVTAEMVYCKFHLLLPSLSLSPSVTG